MSRIGSIKPTRLLVEVERTVAMSKKLTHGGYIRCIEVLRITDNHGSKSTQKTGAIASSALSLSSINSSYSPHTLNSMTARPTPN